MKKIITLLVTAFIVFASSACAGAEPKTTAGIDDGQDIRILTVSNADGKITAATIEAAFEKIGFSIDGNNNMNAPFKPRFKKTFYQTYHLFTTHSAKHTLALAKKYPSIGLISPLSMSLYSNRDDDTSKGKTMSISALTLRGMSRITQIPMTNPDLIAYSKFLEKGLRAALPGGKFKTLSYKNVAPLKTSYATTFTTEFDGADIDERAEQKDDFEAEFEGELEPIGFLFPGFVDFASEFDDAGYDAYEQYDTYSICKLDVIFPIHQNHPEVGAFAPCSYYIYMKKGEKTVHMGFPSVENWISATDLDRNDKKTFGTLIEAQKLIEDVVNEIIE
ncbi:DUF302 domain-containing protein [Sulfurimonas sp. MAG313]|nr:DUF302 domain-containing protein [Sulfurimonas sp. MAG313]MDF1879836.1 DUF302 domain-containing protein [Sulfurimonas sp. MAG313]